MKTGEMAQWSGGWRDGSVVRRLERWLSGQEAGKMTQWLGGWRGGSVDKNTGCCWRGPEFSPPMVLKTVSNSRSRGSSVLIQASWAPATHVVRTQK